MALNALGLGFIFTARDQATGTIRRIGGSMRGLGNNFRQSATLMGGAAVAIGSAIATMAAGLGTLRGAFNLAQQSSEFGFQIARVGAISRATSAELVQLEERAIQAGIATQFSPTEAAEGLNELAVRGFTAAESMTALTGVLDLAAGGNIGVALSAQSVGAALRVFGLQAEQSGYAVDRLLRISNVTALQANELALALGNVSRGAGLTRQNLEEMLPAIGLVRNTGVEASVASNAVSSALLFMARNANEFQRIGVSVTDAQGRFRPFLDIVMETNQQLSERFPNAAQRSATAMELFGRFGVVAFNAVAEQTRAGIRDTEGNMRRGADAVRYLREQMQSATGAAEEFREQLLNTFRGQLVLLQGTVQTLGVVLGSPFARAFRPFVTAITQVLNAFIRLFRLIPTGLQTALASSVLAGAAFMVLAGALTAVVGVAALLIPVIDVVAIVLGVVAAVMAPVVIGATALAGAIVNAAFLIRRNVGGLGDFFSKVFSRIQLAFRALGELFGQGGFSQEVDEALQGANRPIRAFVVTVYRAGHRLSQLWNGVRAGIDMALVAARPAVEAFITALRQLGSQLGFVSGPLGQLASTPSERFKMLGIAIGKFIGRALTIIVDVGRQVIGFFQGAVAVGRTMWMVLGPAFAALANEFQILWQAIQVAVDQFAALAGQGRSSISWGQLLGGIVAHLIVPAIFLMVIAVGAAVRIISTVIRVGNAMRAVFLRVFFALMSPLQTLNDAWVALRTNIMTTVRTLLSGLASVRAVLPAPLRAAIGLAQGAGMAGPAQGAVIQDAERVADPGRELGQRLGTVSLGLERASIDQRGQALEQAMAARNMGMSALAGMSQEQIRNMIAQQMQTNALLGQQRTTIVQVDGREIARAVSSANRTDAAASGAPVVGGGEV